MARTKKPVDKNLIKQIKNRAKKKPSDHIKNIRLLPSPSTLLNLACSDSAYGAFSVGRMINIIGDSSSGKTLFALSCLAEAAKKKCFDKYRLIFDDVENANTFNILYLFGQLLAKRIEPASLDTDNMPVPSETIEDMHCNIMDAIDHGQPFIYVTDSFDALDSEQDQEKIEDMRMARSRGTKSKGSYGMSKPKKSSELLRSICGKLKKTESILIIISQTRDNINPMSFEKKTRSGGRALKFYAHHEIWLAMAKKHESKGVITGANVKAKVSKNKLTGKVRNVEFPIFYDMGIDDIRSCIDFLVREKIWKKTKQTIEAKGLGIKGSMHKLIKTIEEKNLEHKLQKITDNAWNKIESSIRLNRKRRYN